MKKITLLLATMILASVAYSQNMVSARLGWGGSAAGGSFSAFYYGAAAFEKPISEKATIGLGLDFLSGASAAVGVTTPGLTASASSTWIGFEPRITYYTKDLYRGFFIGSNIAFNYGMGDVASYLQVGPRLGWMFSLSDQFKLGIESQFGYAKSFSKEITYSTGSGTATFKTEAGGGIYSRFGLSLGYVLGGK
jgi:hypothetical protein